MLLESRKLAAIKLAGAAISRSKLAAAASSNSAAAALLLLLASKSSIANTEKKISSNINLAIAAQLTAAANYCIQQQYSELLLAILLHSSSNSC